MGMSAKVLEKHFIQTTPANTGTIFPSYYDVESRSYENYSFFGSRLFAHN
jgi:hypothetical protein